MERLIIVKHKLKLGMQARNCWFGLMPLHTLLFMETGCGQIRDILWTYYSQEN